MSEDQLDLRPPRKFTPTPAYHEAVAKLMDRLAGEKSALEAAEGWSNDNPEWQALAWCCRELRNHVVLTHGVEERPTTHEALTKFVSCIEATGGALEYPSGIGGCVADPDWLDLADAYVDACAALARDPVVQVEDEEEYEGGTESILDSLQKLPAGDLDALMSASEAVVRAATGIRG